MEPGVWGKWDCWGGVQEVSTDEFVVPSGLAAL